MSSPADAFAEIRLRRAGDAPMYRQIYDRIRGGILSGRLVPGTRLPSSRSLASELGTARSTVELAYEILAGEGYVLTRGAAGTIVHPTLESRATRQAARTKAAPGEAEAATPTARWREVRPFQPGLPGLDVFPRKLWARLAARRARETSTATMLHQDPAGYRPLREAVAAYLAIARGIACAPEQVFLTAGYQGALGLITRVLMQAGDAAWMEDPGYFRTRQALALAGARVVPVPVDAEGLRVPAGMRAAPTARLAVVTPAHHSPLGVSLSLQRRLALLAWAAKAGAWIVEDDYDSEFRYRGRPLPALGGLDQGGRVVYAGTFSKVLLPSLRLGYVAVPPSQATRFAATIEVLAPSPSPLEQRIVADFMEGGHFARHLRRMRAVYRQRRTALQEALAEVMGDRLRADSGEGGMNLVAWLPSGSDDRAAAARAQADGLAVSALSQWVVKARVEPALILGYTNIAPTAAKREARRLDRALHG
jgi:GntR family transcriptional regulator/MocR family aminotransferase